MSNSDKIGGPNKPRDPRFAEPSLGATLAEMFDYLVEHYEAGKKYVSGGEDDYERAAFGAEFVYGALLSAARAGELRVRGRRMQDGATEYIPLEALRSERLDFDPTMDNGRGRFSLTGTIWREPRFDIEQSKKIWPEPESIDTQPPEPEETVPSEQAAVERGEISKIGRKTVQETLTLTVLAEFDRHIGATECTFKRGEFTTISDAIAKVTGYKTNSVQGIIRPGYKELKAAKAASASVEASSPQQK